MADDPRIPRRRPPDRAPQPGRVAIHRDDDPTQDPVYLAVAAVAHEDRPAMERQFWYDEWWHQWQATYLKVLEAEQQGQDPSDAEVALLRLLRALRDWRAGNPLVWLRGGAKPDLDVWEHRVIVRYLKTGEYRGPVRRDNLPRPDPLWSDERLGVLAADWGDVLVDVSRRTKVLGYPKYCIPFELGPLERWEVLKPLAFAHLEMGCSEALWERLQLVASVVNEFQDAKALARASATAACGHADCAEKYRVASRDMMYGLQGLLEDARRVLSEQGPDPAAPG